MFTPARSNRFALNAPSTIAATAAPSADITALQSMVTMMMQELKTSSHALQAATPRSRSTRDREYQRTPASEDDEGSPVHQHKRSHRSSSRAALSFSDDSVDMVVDSPAVGDKAAAAAVAAATTAAAAKAAKATAAAAAAKKAAPVGAGGAAAATRKAKVALIGSLADELTDKSGTYVAAWHKKVGPKTLKAADIKAWYKKGAGGAQREDDRQRAALPVATAMWHKMKTLLGEDADHWTDLEKFDRSWNDAVAAAAENADE